MTLPYIICNLHATGKSGLLGPEPSRLLIGQFEFLALLQTSAHEYFGQSVQADELNYWPLVTAVGTLD